VGCSTLDKPSNWTRWCPSSAPEHLRWILPAFGVKHFSVFFYKKNFDLELSGNEVHYAFLTNCVVNLIAESCKLIVFPHTIKVRTRWCPSSAPEHLRRTLPVSGSNDLMWKRLSIEKLSGDEVCNTFFHMLMVKIMLCSELDSRKFQIESLLT